LILLSFDLETTGLDLQKDQPIEVGAVLYSTGQNKIMEAASYLVKTTLPITAEITSITGIHQVAVDKFGFSSQDGLVNLLGMMKDADAIIGHNVIRYDRNILLSWANRERMQLPEKLWIDTRTDLPGIQSNKLQYMAADHGFLNLFPHSALTDALTVVKLVSTHDINEVVKLAQSPLVVLVGKQSRADNSLAKTAKFAWNPDYKIWWKIVKECQLEGLTFPFPVEKAGPEVLVEKLWYS
jgi:DNA polymerase III subunit epsilon